MTGEVGRPRPRRRTLSAEERALWKTVTRSVARLRPAESAAEPEAEPSPVPPPAPKPAAALPQLARPSKPKPPPLAPLEKRMKQRVARGREPIDARIDLHGLTQDRAHDALARFVRHAQARGAKLVLVITGKGSRDMGSRENDAFVGERGVLRRLVPLWLGLPEFRGAVIGFEPAHKTHGGEGALYIRIRRRQT